MSGKGVKRVRKTRVELEGIRKKAQVRQFEKMCLRFDMVNELLYKLEGEIRSSVPVEHGVILPVFSKCSDEGCVGCLHVKFKRWLDPAKDAKKKKRVFGGKQRDVKSAWVAVFVVDPLNKLPRGDAYKDYRDLMKAFVTVLNMRDKMVKHAADVFRVGNKLESEI